MLPNPRNRVTLDESEVDENGVPVARVTFSYRENDRAMIEHIKNEGEKIMEAAGADRILFNEGNHHVLGTCRMGIDPGTFGRRSRLPNARRPEPVDMRWVGLPVRWRSQSESDDSGSGNEDGSPVTRDLTDQAAPSGGQEESRRP